MVVLAVALLSGALRLSSASSIPLGTDAAPPVAVQADSAASTITPATTPWRAIWVVRDRLRSKESAIEAVRGAAALGATDLLVQVRGRGDACYRSALVPPPSFLSHQTERSTVGVDSLTWDPLGVVLEEAHRRGIRVHAWMNVYLAWSERAAPPATHALTEHPDWVVRLADGTSMVRLSAAERKASSIEGVFLDPTNVEARAHLVAVVEELVARYPIDGLHWDYVRAPRLALAAADDSLREAVSAFVREAAAAARAINPALDLSAAVYPDPAEARLEIRQEWPRWLEQGWIDRALPMCYTASPARLDDWSRRERASGVDPARVVTGLGVYRLDEAGLRAQLDWAAASSPAGIALFSLDDVEKNERLARLVAARWNADAPAPEVP